MLHPYCFPLFCLFLGVISGTLIIGLVRTGVNAAEAEQILPHLSAVVSSDQGLAKFELLPCLASLLELYQTRHKPR